MTATTDDAVGQRYQQLAEFAAAVARSLHEQVTKLGFDAQQVTLHSPDQATYRLERDPADGGHSLVGEWRDERGQKFGELLFHADGSFFVEQDIARPHPVKAGWFVEAVNAWGRDGLIKAEARLLPMPD